MMTVSVHVDERTSAELRELECSHGLFVNIHITNGSGAIDMFMPMSRIDDARRITRALNNIMGCQTNE